LPELDGAVLIAPPRAQLCVNSFSTRHGALQASQLYRKLADVGAVIDPVVQEGLGAAFIADSDLDRRKEESVLNYIRKKYGDPALRTFRPNLFRAAVTLPRDDQAPKKTENV
jgi:hypothetical protein